MHVINFSHTTNHVTVCVNMNSIINAYLPSQYYLINNTASLAGLFIFNIMTIVHCFNHKPDVKSYKTPLCVILHKNLRKVNWDECQCLTRLFLTSPQMLSVALIKISCAYDHACYMNVPCMLYEYDMHVTCSPPLFLKVKTKFHFTKSK